MKTLINKEKDCIKLGIRKCAWDGGEREAYKVPLELLHYNIDNGRISTWVSGYRQANGQDCFDNKTEEEIRKIILSYIIEANEKAFKKTKDDIKQKGQIVAGVILEDGTIVAGNRRFSALLKAREETGDFNKYRYFICHILKMPKTEEEKKSIKRIEIETQYGEDKPVEYGAIERLVDVYQNVMKEGHVCSESEYRKYLGYTLPKMRDMMTEATIMIEFLKYVNQPYNFDYARKLQLDGPFHELVNLKKAITIAEWDSIKGTYFKMLNVKKSGDRTRDVRKLVKAGQNPVTRKDLIEGTKEASLSELEDMVGGEVVNQPNPDKAAPAKLDDNTAKLIKTVIAKNENDTTVNQPITKAQEALVSIGLVDIDRIAKMNASGIKQLEEAIDDIESIIVKIRKQIKNKK